MEIIRQFLQPSKDLMILATEAEKLTTTTNIGTFDTPSSRKTIAPQTFRNVAHKAMIFVSLLDTLHDFYEDSRGKSLIESLKKGSKMNPWNTILGQYKINTNMAKKTEELITEYLKKYSYNGGNQPTAIKLGVGMIQKLKGNRITNNYINIKPLRIIGNPNVTKVKHWAFYTAFYEYLIETKINQIMHTKKEIYNGDTTNSLFVDKVFGFTISDVYQIFKKKNYQICIDAMDTSSSVPFSYKSLYEFKVITIAQIFDAAAVSGFTAAKNKSGEKHKFFFMNKPLDQTDVNDSKIFNKVLSYFKSGLNPKDHKIEDNYRILYQGTSVQLDVQFIYFVMIPNSHFVGGKLSKLTKTTPDFELSLTYDQVGQLIFFMIPKIHNNWYENSYVSAQIITKYNLTLNNNFGTISKNSIYKNYSNGIVLLKRYQGLGVSELVDMYTTMQPRTTRQKTTTPTNNDERSKFLRIMFDSKRALDGFQIDMCKKIGPVFLITHDYIAAVIALIKKTNVILVHKSIFYIFKSNKNVSNRIIGELGLNSSVENVAKVLMSLRDNPKP